MTREKINRRIHEFLNIKSLRELSMILGESQLTLFTNAHRPKYDTFSVPKPKGGWREIENPHFVLKDIQRKLNKFLQAVYFKHRTKAAYGFMIGVKRTSDRNIVTHALQHLNKSHLVNLDYKDFFHCIKKSMITNIYTASPFNFENPIANLLSSLCTYKGRLAKNNLTKKRLKQVINGVS